MLPVDRSRVIMIEFHRRDPELSARVVNAIVDAYFTIPAGHKQEQTRGASRWLASEIDKLRPKVIEADDKVEEFRAKANLFVGTNNSNLANQQLTELTIAARGRARAEGRSRRQVADHPRHAQIPASRSKPTMSPIRS